MCSESSQDTILFCQILTGKGLDKECCGDDRATGSTLLPGLVPGPLPPAN